ncbi:MAG: ROK family protein [Victivallales bacterium]|nr:ROK family protein [Victivallales bacterium]
MNIIGIDIGGTKCSVVKATLDGRPLEQRRFQTTSVCETLERIYSAVAELEPGESPVFGIACGGPLDASRGIVMSPPNLPDWDNIPIVAELTSRFGGKGYLMNDANACALAEWQFGAGRGTKNIVFLTYGTGMGAGLILDGRLYEGTSGDAGEVGHLRLAPDGPVGYGKAGSFEGFCSGRGLARLATGKIPGHPNPTAKELAELADCGCKEALEIWEESSRRLGQALAVIVDFFNPEVIVLGSIFVRSARFLEVGMREVLVAEALPQALAVCRIVPAELGESTGIMSAIAVAKYHLEQHQSLVTNH